MEDYEKLGVFYLGRPLFYGREEVLEWPGSEIYRSGKIKGRASAADALPIT